MNANPEPDDSIRCLNFNRSVMEPDAGRPESADFLEMQRRMLRICLQEFKSSVGLFTDGSREGVVVRPKIRSSVVDQIFVDFSAA